MQNIILWGTGKEYSERLRRIQCGVALGEFGVIGVTANDPWYHMLDGFRFIDKRELMDVPHDYILVTSSRHFDEIRDEYLAMGGSAEKVLPVQVLDVANLTFSQVAELHQAKPSIIANNCWGGRTYHILHMRFYSPFINMFMLDDDYIALLRDFRHRLSLPLKHVGTSYDEGSKLHYPIFSLGGTHLHMNHYADRAFAEEKWQERLQRLNKEHLFFMMFTERPNIAEAFDALPYDRKVCFTSFPTDLPSAMYVKPYAACQKPLGKPFWQTINGMANGTYPYYDIYELLMHGKKTYRSV